MERIGKRGDRSHAHFAGLAAAGLFGAQAFGAATPQTPDPRLDEPGRLRAGFINNQYQTDPPQKASVVRHPFALELETSVSERLSLEASLSDGIGLGLRAGLLTEAESPIDLAVGFDELLFPVQSHLFGRDSANLTWVPGRAWVAVAQTWEFLRARGALSMRPTRDGLEFVPHLALETAFKLPFSVGWESSWESSIWRQSVGLSVTLKPIVIAGGLSEFQSWIFRDRDFGWYPTPRRGKLDGFDNPGWWLAVKWDLPPLRTQTPAPMPIVNCPAPVLDGDFLQPVVDLLQQRLLREEVAELAVRSSAEISSNPVTMAVLRRRILAGGPSARSALWRIILDTAGEPEDRRQAVITLGEDPILSDLSGFAELASDPVPELRIEAAMSLGKIGNPEALSLLGGLSRDPEESVRVTAKALLEIAASHDK